MELDKKSLDTIVDTVGAEAAKKIQEGIETATKSMAKAEDVENLKKTIEGLNLDAKSIKIGEKSLEEVLAQQGQALNDIKQKSAETKVESNNASLSFKSEVESRKEDWDKFMNKQAPFSLNVKAVGTNTRTSLPTSPSDFLPEHQLISGYTPYRTNDPLMLSSGASIMRTSNAIINWVDETAGEGDAGWTAEGAAKPQMDVNATVRSTTVEKVAVTQKVSEEALADISFMGDLMENRMRNKLALKLDDGLLTGDGTSNTPTGLEYYAPAFTSTEMNNTIEDPNYFDALSAAATQIERANFTANRVFINPVDWYKMMHTKDADKGYVLLQLSMQNGNFLNMTAIKSNQVTAGEFIMGDMRYFNIAIREDVRYEAGWENDDFTKNLRTFRAETRVAAWVSENEKLAFCKDTYANVIDAIEFTGS